MKVRKVKAPDIHTPPLAGKHKQQRFSNSMRSGVLTSISSRQRSALQTHLCPSHPHYGLHPAMFSGSDYF